MARFVLALALCLSAVHCAPIDKFSVDSGATTTGTRTGRAILSSSWFDYLPTDGITDQMMSRSNSADDPLNSPIYYIRLPPNPYSFVPGLGYVSQPDPAQLPVAPPPPPPPPPTPIRRSPFIQLPLEFLANGKPGSTVLTWPSDPIPQQPTTIPPPRTKPPKKTSKPSVTKLKGPYFFNGKPSGLFILQQDPYNSLYADMLHNFYP
ncbi:hypothetical protein B566_EDAN013824 [Ephemera danica]|nr:hypothetical protein B566_EDAN013824 [Ephemera danica]